ncbi:hypothetical protein [Bradyrhizobium genomosp. III]|uniref:hypothetical protein n=1 Tax=Bradyrhizobium genomosp. III TaxID=2683271 RepID=UPI000576054B|nr:hypothetical protein [Bradyrhizobium sp. CCBAU 15635]
MSNILTFPGSLPESSVPPAEPQEASAWRDRAYILQDIERHVAARRAYAKAVAWEIAVQDQNLPAAQLEAAREATAEAYRELSWAGHALVATTPADPKALVDLLLYMEKNFSTLPQEVVGRSLALDLIHTVRLSLRKITRYGKSK